MKVLLVDDSDDDLVLTRRAFRQSEHLALIGRVANGEEAIQYLMGAGEFADREKYPFPDFLLLDIRMPILDGFELLAWLKEHPFPNLKVAMYSGSDRPCDIQKALELGALFYFFKEQGAEKVCESLEALQPLPCAAAVISEQQLKARP